ncbi:PREDICTED: melanoma-associated antigen 10-like [Chinchilla lanigera]|uniref:melanoma-associated antigen 10-like n=1 Tax=Chinchilla lanigera TaxID=34839 RepID=UPI000697054F|nr:PREDICTED: melanoma-associated antigen 10-like [Chinchilla lanigera]
MSESPEQHQLEEDLKGQGSTEEVSDPEVPDLPQDAEGGSSPPDSRATTPSSPSAEGFSIVAEECFLLTQAVSVVESLMGYSINDKMTDLMVFLFQKYRKKEMTTHTEMLQCVFLDCEESFPEIFRIVSECMYLVFGIDVKKAKNSSQCYIIMPALGLSYDGTVEDVPSFPKTTILIIVLGVIFFQGNCAREEAIWDVLSGIEVFPGSEHLIYGEPRKFITEDLVNEHYLENRLVPNSDPPEYEFLWGPRALIETTKLEVLEFLAKVKDTTPSAFTVWYEEALREEEERFQLPDLPDWL